jgi:response regulator of citrate/malate metabolism
VRNHILLVEDDNSVAYLLQQHLERFGFRVSRAQNLQHVDDEVKTLVPDLVLQLYILWSRERGISYKWQVPGVVDPQSCTPYVPPAYDVPRFWATA